MTMEPTAPVLPVAPYVGGKRKLAKRIIEVIDGIAHTTYAEPFVGMGGVFLRRSRRPSAEIINDYSRDVANFFRILQRHYVPFVEMLRFQIATRAEFDRLSKTDPATLTDLERAARFLYLQRTTFGGKVQGRNFGVFLPGTSRFNVTKIIPMLEDVHTRLTRVVIECLPYADFIRRYDRPYTLFYCDPPYWGSEDYYGKSLFTKADFTILADRLAGIKGRFILSMNDVPPIRDLFAAFTIIKADTTYTFNDKKYKPAKELIITNTT